MGINQADWHKRRITGGKRPIIRHKRKFEMGRQPANTKWSPGIEPVIRDVRGRGGHLKKRALKLDTASISWGSEGVTRPSRIVGVVYHASDNDLVRTNTLVKGSVVSVDASRFRDWYEQHYGVNIGKKRTTKAAPKGAAKQPAGKAAPKSEAAPKAEGEKKEAADKPAAEATADKTATPAAADKKAGAKGAEKKADAKTTDKKAEGDAAKKEKQGKQPATNAKKLKKRQEKRVLEQGLEELFQTGRLYALITSRPGQTGRCNGYILEGKELEFYLKKIQKKK